jgi:lipopolysaccharide export system permease protein
MAAWLVVTGVLLIILLADQVIGVLDHAAANQFPRSVVLDLIWLGALQDLSILVPVGLLLGVVLAFGRLYADSEMAAALACGAGPMTLYLPVAGLALLVSAGVAWVTLVLAPQASERALGLRQEAIRAGQFAPLVSGKFRTFAGGDVAVYAEDADRDGTLHNVFVERSRGPIIQVALADRARHTVTPDGTTHILTLYDGERFEGTPGSGEFRIVRFAEHVVPVQVPSLNEAVSAVETRPTAELLASSDPKLRAELQWRVAMPLMCLILTLLAVPLARLRPRQGRYARIWVAGLIFLLYSQLISAGKVWLAHASAPPLVGLWWTHAVVIVFALLVILGPKWVHRLRYRVRGL